MRDSTVATGTHGGRERMREEEVSISEGAGMERVGGEVSGAGVQTMEAATALPLSSPNRPPGDDVLDLLLCHRGSFRLLPQHLRGFFPAVGPCLRMLLIIEKGLPSAQCSAE